MTALILSGAVSFAAVFGVASLSRPHQISLAPAIAARSWTRPPPPVVHPLDDTMRAEPTPMHEAPAGKLIYLGTTL